MATKTATYTRPSGSTGDDLLSRRGRAIAAIMVGRRCPVCGRRFARGKKSEMQIDHLIPCSNGGHQDLRNNIAPLCGSCNASKCDSDLHEWLLVRAPKVGATKAQTPEGIARAAHKIAGEMLAISARLTRALDEQDAW